MDAMAAVEADRQEQEALDGILSELTALRAGCGLAPPPHGAGMSDTFQLSGTSAGRPDQQVVNAGGTSATSIGITENPTPHSSTFPRTSLDPTVRTSQDETFSRLLSELSTANSSKIRAALFQSLLVPMPFITCEQLAHVFRYLELPSEKIQVARLVRGKIEDPENVSKSLLPLLSNGTVASCNGVMSILLQ
eukprot:m.14452 g.14452  ORF g.14452 m.14452 type:complete len:192 (+) comp8374_c0_seq1:34-609(+)